MIKGAYQLKCMDGLVELYTRHAYADYFVNKKTNQIFVKSEFKMFDIENFPPLIEDGDEFSFALHKSLRGNKMSEEELLKDAKPKNILYYDRKMRIITFQNGRMMSG